MKKIFTSILCLIVLVNLPLVGLAQQDTTIEITDYYGHWAENTITEWINNGLIEGYDDGTFKPNNAMSKIEFITLVNRIYGYYVETDENYSDILESIWFSSDCKIAKANGYMNWYQENELKPKESILREEVFSILAIIIQLEPSSDFSGIAKFSDKGQISDWNKNYLDALITAGYIEGNADGTLEPKGTITRAEAVIMIDRVMGELINKAGTYGKDTNLEMQTIETNLTVNTQEVILQNMIIKGDLILATGIADGEIGLNNVTVIGRTIINGGGENSIAITGSNLGEVRVYKVDGKIRVVLEGSEAEILILQSGGKLEGEYRGTEIIINTEDKQEVILEGDFENIVVDSEMNIQVNKESSIEEITFNAEAKVTGQGTIGTAKVNADGVIVEQLVDNKLSSIGINSSGVREKVKYVYVPSNENDITATIIGILDSDMNLVDVFNGTTVSELKTAIDVSSRATCEILDGAGGSPVSDQDITPVTDSMVMQVQAENGTIAEYAIAMTDGTDILHPIHIYTDEQLDEVRNNLGLNYKLEANIDLTNYIADNYDDDETVEGIQGGWEPLGSDIQLFTGTFNGGNHLISNMTINRDADYQGLFGNTNLSSIENIQLENISVISSLNYIGGLAGKNKGTINNINVTGAVTGNDNVGGLIGYNSGSITDSYATGDVIGNDRVGGLVGFYISGTITNSNTTGDVNGNNYVGGLVGDNRGIITNSNAKGDVIGNNYVGGLLGFSISGTITNSYANGNATGKTWVGGLAGSSDGSGCITNSCYATGDVNGTKSVGGLVGYNNGGSITNSYATGDVSEDITAGTGSIGGLVGANGGTGAITNSYATGAVTGPRTVGGLVGFNSGEITNNYALNDSIITFDAAVCYERLVGYNEGGGTIANSYANSSMTINGSTVSDIDPTSIKGADITLTDAMLQLTYTNNTWDFITIWQIDEGISYPSFIWQTVD